MMIQVLRTACVVFVCMFIAGGVQAQSQRMTTEALTASADVIVHGTVTASSAAWNADRTTIYTTVRLAVREAVKNGGGASELAIQIPGGVVGDVGMVVSHTPVLHPGDEVVLFLVESEEPGKAGSPLVVRGGEQGVAHVLDGIVETEQLRVGDYKEMVQRLNAVPVSQQAAVRATFQSRRVEKASKSSAASISSFTPTSASGGTGTVVTITGSGFGATQGSGSVAFTKVPTSTYQTATILTWSDTEIKCLVPVGASSGPILVTPDGGSAVNSATDFDLTYAFGSRKWAGSSPTVTYYINANTGDISGSDEYTALANAMATWNASGANFTFFDQSGGTATAASSNGTNEIFWGTIDGAGGTLARNTNWFYSSDGTIIESDIEFDDAETWSLCTSSCSGQFDVETVALHELGHTYNFYDSYHSNDAPSGGGTPKVMYGYSSTGTTQRSLFAADIDGAKAIYGPVSGGGSLAGGGYLTSAHDAEIYTVPDNASLDVGSGELTIEAWIHPTATPPELPDGYYVIAAKSDLVDDRSYELILRSDLKVEFRVSTNGTSMTSKVSFSAISLDEWAHVRGIILNSGGNKYIGLMVNGSFTNGVSGFATDVTSLHNSSAEFAIAGVDYDGTDTAAGEFEGYIDEVRLSSDARWHSTSAAHALPHAFDTDSATEGFWKFDFASNTLLNHAGSNAVELSAESMSGSMPVELIAFDAVTDREGVVLTWKTASETNNAGFFVEQRAAGGEPDAEVWQTLGFVEGYGTIETAKSYSYRIASPEPGRHVFRLKQIDFDGTFEYHPEVEVFVELPGTFALSAAYPNPFNPATTLDLAVSRAQSVRVEVFDALGRKVRVLHDGPVAAHQTQRLRFEADGLPGGLYMVRATGETFTASRSMVLFK